MGIDPDYFDKQIHALYRTVPAHISTTLMFALLKKCFDLAAEMVGEPDLRPDGRAVERWRLVEKQER